MSQCTFHSGIDRNPKISKIDLTFWREKLFAKTLTGGGGRRKGGREGERLDGWERRKRERLEEEGKEGQRKSSDNA